MAWMVLLYLQYSRRTGLADQDSWLLKLRLTLDFRHELLYIENRTDLTARKLRLFVLWITFRARSSGQGSWGRGIRWLLFAIFFILFVRRTLILFLHPIQYSLNNP